MLNITGVCVFSLAALGAGVFDNKCMKKNLNKRERFILLA